MYHNQDTMEKHLSNVECEMAKLWKLKKVICHYNGFCPLKGLAPRRPGPRDSRTRKNQGITLKEVRSVNDYKL